MYGDICASEKAKTLLVDLGQNESFSGEYYLHDS